MSARRPVHLDPRSPLVLDTRELGRRPGSMRHVRRTVDAPADWALGLVRVPAGADVELDFRLEAVMEGVLVTGTADAPLAAECGRCLEPTTDRLTVDVQDLFGYERSPDDPEAPILDGDLLDLTGLLRDAVLLALPLNPVCSDDCPGLCPGCGGKLADLGPDHSHDTLDPRWAALGTLAPDRSPSTPSMQES
ncbi:MAG: hypothetical protein QOD07_636 [Frankiaceae bacterium]|jgi:uncharacterized protein|nr:hypothetical protein [Frankiaceae bacterium]